MCYKDIYIVFFGNKNDLNNQRTISKHEGKRFTEENYLKFYETIALNGNNIEELFIKRKKIKKIKKRNISNNLKEIKMDFKHINIFVIENSNKENN